MAPIDVRVWSSRSKTWPTPMVSFQRKALLGKPVRVTVSLYLVSQQRAFSIPVFQRGENAYCALIATVGFI